MENDIFDHFGPTARRILITSQKIAQTMGTAIGSEHLLLALAATPRTLSYEILKGLGVSADQVRLVINFNNLKTQEREGLSAEIQKIIDLAAKKTSELDQTRIEAEHLLWAISYKQDSLAHQVLLRVGVEPKQIQKELENIFEQSSPISSGGESPLEEFGFMPPGGLPPDLAFGIGPTGPLGTKMLNRPKTKSATPFLDEFGADLTQKAQNNKLDPIIGREKEIKRAIQILCRRTKNNPVLVGDPGVGKTAIVEGISQKVSKGEVPTQLKNKRVIALDLPMIVAGTMYRGQFEDRLKRIIEEVKKANNIILFIDEIHSVVGAGAAEGSMDAANILKPQLAKGELRLIGATTTEEYRKYIEKDPALERRLQKIDVPEPSAEETIAILKGIKSRYEEHHGVIITDDAVKTAVYLAKRYISDRFLPDKAIDLVDEAASATHLLEKIGAGQSKLVTAEKELELLIKEKEQAIALEDFERAAHLRQRELQLKDSIEKLKKKLPPPEKEKITIIADDIARVVSLWTGIPLTNLVEAEKVRLANLETILKKRVLGQEEAVEAVSHAIKRSRSGIANPKRPIGAFVFLGPTGVGKTELAKVLAEVVFGSEENLVKIDMSEFMERHNVSRLVGAPPGYVGYEEAGKLTEGTRRRPYSVILFDEIEKAHPEVFNILLQILEDGYLTDAKGRRINFRNTIVILTSNIGMGELSRQAALGFRAASTAEKESTQRKYEEMKNRVLGQLKEVFKPELLNRLDKTIVFRPLTKDTIKRIVSLQINELIDRAKTENIRLVIDNSARSLIAERGFDPNYGARPVRRAIADYIENPLSDKLINGEIKKGAIIRISAEKNKIVFRTGHL